MTVQRHAIARILYTENQESKVVYLQREWNYPVQPAVGVRVLSPVRKETKERLILLVDRISVFADTGVVFVLLVPKLTGPLAAVTALGNAAALAPENRTELLDPYLNAQDASTWIESLKTAGFTVIDGDPMGLDS